MPSKPSVPLFRNRRTVVTRLTQPSLRRIGKVAGAFGRSGPIGRALGACRRKCLSHAFSIEIGGVHRCSGLLPPGVVQSAGIDSAETEFIDKLQDDGLGLCIVARNGQGNSTRRSMRPTAFEQMARIDVR